MFREVIGCEGALGGSSPLPQLPRCPMDPQPQACADELIAVQLHLDAAQAAFPPCGPPAHRQTPAQQGR